MNPREEAVKLAERPYFEKIVLDETTDGEPIFVAYSPELEGCIAQGDTVEEARKNLSEARVDCIQSLLEDGLPVPDPADISPTTTTIEIR